MTDRDTAGEEKPAGPRQQLAARDTLVVLLTLTTGSVDAASFLALGNVFSSVITGNLVLLGVAAGAAGSGLAARSGMALAGYTAGVLVGAPVAARSASGKRPWPISVTVTLAAELCVLAAFTAGWELAGGHPRGDAQFGLLVLLAAAMGMQSAAVRRLGQMSTTYLTGTLTGVVASLVTGRKPEGLRRSLGVLAGVIAGATASTVMLKTAPAWLPAVVLVPLAAVIAVSAAAFGRTGQAQPDAARDVT